LKRPPLAAFVLEFISPDETAASSPSAYSMKKGRISTFSFDY